MSKLNFAIFSSKQSSNKNYSQSALYLFLFHWIMDFSNLAISCNVNQFHNLALLLVLNVKSGWLQEHLRHWGSS